MNELVRALAAVAADLEGLGRPWALVGGLAVSARAEPRTTRDVDIAVSVTSDAEAEQAVATHLGRGYVLEAAVEGSPLHHSCDARPGSVGRGLDRAQGPLAR